MNAKEIERFRHNFTSFSAVHPCSTHSAPLSLLCIEESCSRRGLVCKLCSTSSHDHHHTIDASQYIEEFLKDFEAKGVKVTSGDEIDDLMRRINQIYEELQDILGGFIEACGELVKNYQGKRREFNEMKVMELDRKFIRNKLIQCKFASLTEANKTLSLLPKIFNFGSAENSVSSKSKELLENTQNYLKDVTYESFFIGRELKHILSTVKEILTVKESSPIVLHYEPSFVHPRFLENDDVVYIGETKDNKPFGKGICFYKESEKIIFGDYLNGKTDGIAELYYSTGDYFLGEFRGNKKNGRGVYRWNGKDSNVYEGEFKNGRRDGRGTFWWSDGTKYVGEFLKGEQTGSGVLYKVDNTVEYEGCWLNGQFHGKGVQNFQNGIKFQGEFKDDKFHGEGVLVQEKQALHGKWKDNELVVILEEKSEKDSTC